MSLVELQGGWLEGLGFLGVTHILVGAHMFGKNFRPLCSYVQSREQTNELLFVGGIGYMPAHPSATTKFMLDEGLLLQVQGEHVCTIRKRADIEI